MSNRRSGTIQTGYGSAFSSEDLPFLAVLSGAIGSLMLITILFIVVSGAQVIPFNVPESLLSESSDLNYSDAAFSSGGERLHNIKYSVVHSTSAKSTSYEWAVGEPLPSDVSEEDLKIFPRYLFKREGVPAYPLASARCNTTYSVLLSAKGGQEPLMWQLVDGVLPHGISLNTSGALHGIPVKEGLYNFIVMVTDAEGSNSSRKVELTVFSEDTDGLWLATDNLPDAVKGLPYRIALAATGGYGHYNWSTRGELPDGLDFDAETGMLNGTPKSTGDWYVEVTVEDERSLRCTRLLCISVRMGRSAP